MNRACLLPREIKAVQAPQHPGPAAGGPEAARDQGAKITDAPGNATLPLAPGTLEGKRLEGGLLAFVQGARTTGAGAVFEAIETFAVVAVHPLIAPGTVRNSV